MQSLTSRIEGWLYHPQGFWQHLLIWALSPLGWIVCFASWRSLHQPAPKASPLPVVAVGNLTAGGTGKTPLILALSRSFQKPAIILRGYGRQSRGLVVVAQNGQRLADLKTSGDEAALYATLAPEAIVIVSEDRLSGIHKAHALGAEVVFLDDAFRHRHIEKLDLLIRPTPEPINTRCLPAGPYRLPIKAYDLADRILTEGVDFTRRVQVENATEKMVLFTAIARPQRLEPFLPPLAGRVLFGDHHPFTPQEAKEALARYNATSLLVTHKDAVKLIDFGVPLSILALEVILSDSLTRSVTDYCTIKGASGYNIHPKERP